MLTSGQLLAERYRLGRRIAVGGMGEVWEAADTRLDRKVAVKVLKPELCGDVEFLHRFRIEARTTASLNHQGIAAVHDYGETTAIPGGADDTAYLVMELVEGDPLAGILARERQLSPERTLDVLEQAGHALQAAHERALVHRDVKPGNILVTPAGQVKITDFGIAKAADAAPVTRSGMVMGTAHYIAPEQAVGQEAEPASDVYSLAVVGYECLVGHRPFLSENAVTVAMMHIRDTPPPLPPHVPPGLRALIEATLVKDPRRRYQTGGEFAGAVAAVRAGRPLPTPSAVLAANLGPGTGVGLPVPPPPHSAALPHPLAQHPAVQHAALQFSGSALHDSLSQHPTSPSLPQQVQLAPPQRNSPPIVLPGTRQVAQPGPVQGAPLIGTLPGLHPDSRPGLHPVSQPGLHPVSQPGGQQQAGPPSPPAGPVPQAVPQSAQQPTQHAPPPATAQPGPMPFAGAVPPRPVRRNRMVFWWALASALVLIGVVLATVLLIGQSGLLGLPTQYTPNPDGGSSLMIMPGSRSVTGPPGSASPPARSAVAAARQQHGNAARWTPDGISGEPGHRATTDSGTDTTRTA